MENLGKRAASLRGIRACCRVCASITLMKKSRRFFRDGIVKSRKRLERVTFLGEKHLYA